VTCHADFEASPLVGMAYPRRADESCPSCGAGLFVGRALKPPACGPVEEDFDVWRCWGCGACWKLAEPVESSESNEASW